MIEQEYKYIHIEKIGQKSKTSVYGVYSNSSCELLGRIKWYNHWRQYCFMPAADTVFSKGCMEDINSFITGLMEIEGDAE